MRKAGWSTLPPVEINVEGDTLASADLLDPALQKKINTWIASGCVRLAHFGTPCATFSRARKNDGGPPPLRKNDFLSGVPILSKGDQEKVRLGTLFLDITLQLCAALASVGAFWSIENPATSMLWLMPQMVEFCNRFSPTRIELHMCAFGSLHFKPTSFLTSAKNLVPIGRLCPGISNSHARDALTGTVLIEGRQVYKTKLAQVYPHTLCEAYALSTTALLSLQLPEQTPLTNELHSPDQQQISAQTNAEEAKLDIPDQQDPQVKMLLSEVAADPFGLGSSNLSGNQFEATFALTTPQGERKRPVGQLCRQRDHKQARSGKAVVRAGYQMRRGLVPPLFDAELEPGQAVKVALDCIHPFTEEPQLSETLYSNIELVCNNPNRLLALRKQKLEFWHARATELAPASISWTICPTLRSADY